MESQKESEGVHQRGSKKTASKTSTSTSNTEMTKKEPTKMKEIFGFDRSDLSSWSALVRLMNRPMDPASLGLTRVIFGLFMALDGLQERGMSFADFRWGDPDECRFPLFNFLKPMALPWMMVVYLVMVTGAFGIMLGLFYRKACILFFVPYWYLFFLDKTSWNNHSYLFGLFGTWFIFLDANRYMSLDGLRNPKIRNAHVPLWNYTLLRSQIFLVYFIAGLKKIDFDWMGGHSMNNLSKHWVFMPFKFFVGDEFIDHIVVHIGGLLIDLFLGYLLFFDFTRPLGMIIGASFNLMNSQIFNIGMFPWTMLCTLPLFCYVDWPRRVMNCFPFSLLHSILPTLEEPQYNIEHCLYTKEVIKSEEISQKDKKKTESSPPKSRGVPRDKPGFYHNAAVVGVITYLTWQCLMPYSHSITKGYNNWTNGLYGYSWDMMVHSWNTQHIRISYKIKETGATGFLNPQAFCHNSRWHSHSDMLKQHAACVEATLARDHNVTGVELHYDVWRSLNDRFQQRMFDPRVDVLTAEWSPTQEVSWVFPLLTDLSDWRGKLDEIQRNIFNSTNDTDIVFVADFPGLSLENYVQPEFGNTSIQVMKGQVVVELLGRGDGEDDEYVHIKNITLSEGGKLQVPAGEYHNVHTVSDKPSCYFYLYTNTTEQAVSKNITLYEEQLKLAQDTGGNLTALNETFADVVSIYNDIQLRKQEIMEKSNSTLALRFSDFLVNKYKTFRRSMVITGVALQSIVTGQTFAEAFNITVGGRSEDLE